MTSDEVRRCGGGHSDIRRLLSAGRWCRARRGVYGDLRFAIPPKFDTAYHRRCAALVAVLGGEVAVSHHSAAHVLGLPLPPGWLDRPIAVTRRPPAATNDPLHADVSVTDYDDAEVENAWGVPVLAGARLVLDCCAALPPESALAVADAGLWRGLTTRDALRRAQDARRGRAGSPAARVVLARADSGGRSWFESVSRWWLLESGLPSPTLQMPFRDKQGVERAYADMWWPQFRTIGEADGAGKYDEPGALFAEKLREDWLRDAHRVQVVRWVPAEMRNAEGRAEVVARLRRAFVRRS